MILVSVSVVLEQIRGFTRRVPGVGKEAVDYAVKEIEKLYILESLARRALKCKDCLFGQDTEAVNRVCPGKGNPNAEVMVIGEGPGEDENNIGVPFTGVSGALLRASLYNIGLSLNDIWLTNVLKCHPRGNRTPEYEETKMCLRYLKKEIEVIDPTVIVTLGAVALKAVIGPDAPPVGQAVGHVYKVGDTIVVPSWHPAYVIRKRGLDYDSALEQMLSAFRTALDIVGSGGVCQQAIAV